MLPPLSATRERRGGLEAAPSIAFVGHLTGWPSRTAPAGSRTCRPTNSSASFCCDGTPWRCARPPPHGWRAARIDMFGAVARHLASSKPSRMRSVSQVLKARRAAAAHGWCAAIARRHRVDPHRLGVQRSSLVEQPPSSTSRSITSWPSAPPYIRPGPSAASASASWRGRLFQHGAQPNRPPLRPRDRYVTIRDRAQPGRDSEVALPISRR